MKYVFKWANRANQNYKRPCLGFSKASSPQPNNNTSESSDHDKGEINQPLKLRPIHTIC
ncbi:hypothetical protein MTR_8g098265 [Medicago truncatula]|uniref:Uncharacterized protein n=1 Tax=Medicago truncatula TaxID=3880 RepID=A0A072TU59_MEDTR|nr:hypothetical protein MTR_8g098265 [Medicago truncatula]